MSANAMVTRLNELDEQLCHAFRIYRSGDAATLDEAISMSTVTIDRLLGHLGGSGDTRPPIVMSVLQDFIQTQLEARQMRVLNPVNTVSSFTSAIRRMKKAGSLQELGRQACAELRDALGFGSALLSYVEDGRFVVEESDHGLDGPTVIARLGCAPERACIRRRGAVRTDDAKMPASPGYRELLDSEHYAVAPVVVNSGVAALLHVGYRGAGLDPILDVDVVDAFVSAFSLLYERTHNAERVIQQRTVITRAAARLAEEVDRIATATISFDVDDASRIDPPMVADSALAAPLSTRERQVFEKLVLGLSNAEIADGLAITVETVKTHVKRILRKIGAINRAEVITLYLDEIKANDARSSR